MRVQLSNLTSCGPPGPITQRAGDVLEMQMSNAVLRCAIVAAPARGGGYRSVLAKGFGADAMPAPALLAAARAFVGLSDAGPASAAPNPAAATAPNGGDAVPSVTSSRLPQPVGAVLRGEMQMIGFPPMASFKSTAWFLFPNGVATDCSWVSPAGLTIAALKARKDCTGARWRRAGGTIELQTEDGNDWSFENTYPKPPASHGYRLDFDGINKGGAGFGNPSSGLGSTSVLTGGGLRLSRMGQIEGSTWSAAQFDSNAAFAASGRKRQGLSGEYAIDGYVLRVRQADGVSVERYILIDRESGDGKLYIYLDDRLYWPRGRS